MSADLGLLLTVGKNLASNPQSAPAGPRTGHLDCSLTSHGGPQPYSPFQAFSSRQDAASLPGCIGLPVNELHRCSAPVMPDHCRPLSRGPTVSRDGTGGPPERKQRPIRTMSQPSATTSTGDTAKMRSSE